MRRAWRTAVAQHWPGEHIAVVPRWRDGHIAAQQVLLVVHYSSLLMDILAMSAQRTQVRSARVQDEVAEAPYHIEVAAAADIRGKWAPPCTALLVCGTAAQAQDSH